MENFIVSLWGTGMLRQVEHVVDLGGLGHRNTVRASLAPTCTNGSGFRDEELRCLTPISRSRIGICCFWDEIRTIWYGYAKSSSKHIYFGSAVPHFQIACFSPGRICRATTGADGLLHTVRSCYARRGPATAGADRGDHRCILFEMDEPLGLPGNGKEFVSA